MIRRSASHAAAVGVTRGAGFQGTPLHDAVAAVLGLLGVGVCLWSCRDLLERKKSLLAPLKRAQCSVVALSRGM